MSFFNKIGDFVNEHKDLPLLKEGISRTKAELTGECVASHNLSGHAHLTL
jgi:hypothetical protein